MRRIITILLLLAAFNSRCKPLERTLNTNWFFVFNKTQKHYTAQVPGTIHTDLMSNKLLDDPFYRNNEEKAQWVSKQNWEYYTLFKLTKEEFCQDSLFLKFNGLDTYADVWLNDSLILQTSNMFRTYEVNIKANAKYLNKLKIKFYNADSIANKMAQDALPLVRPCENNRHYVRKAQYHFGWDWAPKLTTCGIWRDVLLIFKSSEQNTQINYSPVKLIQEKDSIGQSFYFTVNGKPTFMKGANWIPADVFLPRVSREKYLNLLLAAKEANINMLRVWGGGIYESDDFYSICDSLGIYIWQDLMFAGAMYPFDDSIFLDNVKNELRDNILRLRKYKCIVLWCGNNEINEAWNNWGWQKQFNISNQDSIKMIHEYSNFFNNVIPEMLAELDSGRDYIASSPLYGWGRKESMTHGDSHYWGLWWGMQPLHVMKEKIPRFMSEYGMQSMPSLATINEYAKQEDFYLESEVMKAHQKFPRGYQPIIDYLKVENLPNSTFELFVTSSQELQSRAMKISIESQLNSKGRCMGSLFWQFNDCWPVCSWSVVDYYGRKKKAYYTIKKGFEK